MLVSQVYNTDTVICLFLCYFLCHYCRHSSSPEDVVVQREFTQTMSSDGCQVAYIEYSQLDLFTIKFILNLRVSARFARLPKSKLIVEKRLKLDLFISSKRKYNK